MNPPRRSLEDYPNHVEAPDPIPDRRITGAHWWDPDRIRHVDDMPHHCPSCGDAIVDEGGITIEYWEGDRRVYHTWCRVCGWTGDIVRVRRMIGHESEH